MLTNNYKQLQTPLVWCGICGRFTTLIHMYNIYTNIDSHWAPEMQYWLRHWPRHWRRHWFVSNPNIDPDIDASINPNMAPDIDSDSSPDIDLSIDPYIDSNLDPDIDPDIDPTLSPTLVPHWPWHWSHRGPTCAADTKFLSNCFFCSSLSRRPHPFPPTLEPDCRSQGFLFLRHGRHCARRR